MKISDAVYKIGINGSNYTKKLIKSGLRLSCIHKANVVIVQKDDENIIIKDRWYDPYISIEDNLSAIYSKNFLVISLPLLNRATKIDKHPMEDFIMPGDNLIIVV